MRTTYRVGVGVVIHNGKVLALKSNSKKDRDSNQPFWELPGGKAEMGELTERATIREVYEEVGIHINLGVKLNTVRNYVNGKLFVVNFFLATLKDGEPEDGYRLAEEHEEYRWVGAEEAEYIKWLPSNKESINRLIEEGIIK